MGERVPVSREGYEELQRLVEELERKRLAASRAVGEAASKGDLSENAEFDNAKEELGRVQGRLIEMKGRLDRAQIIDTSRAPADMVAFGAKVAVRDLDTGEAEVFELVGQGEVDVFKNRILSTSPMGQALMRRKVGDEISVKVPKGTLRFRVEGIEY